MPGVRSHASRSAARPPGSAARAAREHAGAEPGARERHAPRVPDRDPVGAEDLGEQRRAARPADEHRDLLRRDAVAHQLEHLGADELRLGALAAGLQQPHRAVGRPLLAAGLEQAALEVVQGGAGRAGVVIGALGQLDHLRARRRAPAPSPRCRRARGAPARRAARHRPRPRRAARACRSRRAAWGSARRSRRGRRAGGPSSPGPRAARPAPPTPHPRGRGAPAPRGGGGRPNTAPRARRRRPRRPRPAARA